MAWPEEVGDVAHRLAREEGEGLGLDLQERLPGSLERAHVVGREEAVRGLVLAEGRMSWN